MKNCPNCNAELTVGAKKCENCGAEVSSKRSSHSVKKSFNLKTILKIIIPVVAVVIIAAVVFSLISTPSVNSAYLGYLRDNELFISDFSEGYGEEVTEQFKQGNILFGNYRDYIRMSNDGKKIFYVDNYDGVTYKLYYKNTNDLSGKAGKITSNISIYDISDDGSVVTYIKDKGYLYQHNLKSQSDLIDSNVINFVSSDNGKTVLYQKNSEGDKTYQYDLYLSKSGAKGKKVASNVDSFQFVSDDLSVVYYVSNGALYKLNVGKNPKQIVDNVRDIVNVYDSGEVYFTKTDENGNSTLYYYDGNKVSGAVVENYYRVESVATEKPVLVVCSYKETISYSAVVKGKAYEIDKSVVSISVNSAGDELYFTADFNTDSQLTTLYTAKIDNGLKTPKKVTDEVFQGKYLSGEKYVYVKDYNPTEMTGTVYCDNKVVGKSIYFSNLKYSANDDILLFFDNVNNLSARLNKFSNGKSAVIKDNVLLNSLSVYDDSKVIFLANCFIDDGELYVWNNGKMVKIDHDVSATFTIIGNEEYDKKAHTNF